MDSMKATAANGIEQRAKLEQELETQLDAIVAEHFAHWVDTDEEDYDAPMYLQCACGKRFGGNGQHTKHANEARRIVLAAALAACAREAKLEEAKWWEHLVTDALPCPADCMYCARIGALERAVGESK